MSASVAIDLGTTRIKVGTLGGDGRLAAMISAAAPPTSGDDIIRESEPEAYLEAATGLLEMACEGLPPRVPVGIASQRSTFLLWDARSGEPATPLISWQDRRAADWCAAREGLQEKVGALTGLVLSPHYAGPKLAAMLAQDAELHRRVVRGGLLFGTLETWLLFCWTGGVAHETDLTMAARTLLADPGTGGWSDDMRTLFGVPRCALPAIRPTAGRHIALDGGRTVTATVADQASGALAVLGPDRDAVLVNLGTGGFVLRCVGTSPRRIRGFLCGPILGGRRGTTLFAVEGTINGAGAALERFGAGPTPFPAKDTCPEAYCLPDTNGVGSPHWLPRVPFTLSFDTRGLSATETRRVVLEGILFRVREVLDGICPNAPSPRVVLSGGLAEEPFVGEALASLLGSRVGVLRETEASLLGAARLAAGLEPYATSEVVTVLPSPRGGYLPAKYRRWSKWLRSVLGEPTGQGGTFPV